MTPAACSTTRRKELNSGLTAWLIPFPMLASQTPGRTRNTRAAAPSTKTAPTQLAAMRPMGALLLVSEAG